MLTDLMAGMLDRLRGMTDVDVILGKPITTSDATTILPVSRVKIGVASGGSDSVGKHGKGDTLEFGGGGASLTVEPIAFLIYGPNGVRLLPISAPGNGPADRLIDMVPALIEKIEAFLNRDKA